jgi:Skp family chaperone for outer membrane proteins
LKSTKLIFYVVSSGFLLVAQMSFAQVATVDSRKLIASLPQIAKADTMVLQKQNELNQVFEDRKALTQVHIRIADSLMRSRPKDSVSIKAVTRAREMAKELQELELEYNKQLTDYRSVLLTPYMDRINAAIKAVAIRRKFREVMDIQSSGLLWFDPAVDITADVEAALKQQ